MSHSITCTAFEGQRRIATGALAEVVAKTKAVMDRPDRQPVLIFDDQTSEVVEVDFRGSIDDVLGRIGAGAASPPQRGPGRPKLGVVAREVTLLPRHWEWLSAQPGGASVALRRLVDEARHASEGKDRVRQARESAYRFMSALAGNEPGYEEAIRALFAGQRDRFESCTKDWPADVRNHAAKLALEAWESAQ